MRASGASELLRLVAPAALAALAATAAADQNVSVQLALDTQRITVGTTLSAEVIVRSSGKSITGTPRLEVPNGLQVVGTSTSGPRLKAVGLDTEFEQRYIYLLRGRRSGRFELGPARVTSHLGTLESNTAPVEIVEPPRPQPRRPDPGEPRTATPEGRELLLIAETDKQSVFVGEQLHLDVKLLTQVEVKNIKLVEQSNIVDFWVEELALGDLQRTRLTYEGRRYDSYTVRKLVLFPTTSGRLTIDRFAFELNVVKGDFLFEETRSIQRQTEPLEIEARPLPREGRAAAFAGVVGDWELEAKLDLTTGTTDDAFALTVIASGRGNLQSLPEPRLPELRGFKHYISSSSLESDSDAEQLGGRKSWEFVLLPRAVGRLTVPALELAFFSPRLREYRVTRTQPIAIEVGAGSQQPATSPVLMTGGGKNLLRESARDIAFIKLESMSRPASSGLLEHRLALLGLLVLPLVLNAVGLTLLLGRRRPRDEAALRRKQAASLARRRLRQARRLLEGGRPGELAEELSRLTSGFLSDRLDGPATGLPREEIRARLQQAQCPEAVINAVHRLLDRCDFYRFTPAREGARDLSGLFREARVVLGALERHLAGSPR